MKTITSILILTFATGVCLHAQPEITGAKWNVILKISDENGRPIAGAQVSIGYHAERRPGQSEAEYRENPAELEGQTGIDGVFTASHADTSRTIRIDVKKANYYPIAITHQMYMPGQFDEQTVNASRNPKINMVLKPIMKPTAMYAKRITNLRIPAFNKAIAYDLMVGDWVAPYGKGLSADLFFSDTHTNAQSGYILGIIFPNPHDGIQEFAIPDAEQGSRLRSGYEAPIDGYQPQYEQTRLPDPNRGYYFRVRTKTDNRGNIVSAYYGKIYGDIPQFAYYLSPTPNDRNVEFDPGHNLLKNQTPLERVSGP